VRMAVLYTLLGGQPDPERPDPAPSRPTPIRLNPETATA